MAAMGKVLVWDAPTRVVHWLLAVCFVLAYATSEGRGAMAVHVTLGYTMLALVGFRLVWGVIGTRHARFASFIKGPQAVMGHVSDLMLGRVKRELGHNPLGGWGIVAMLAAILAVVGSGWVYVNGGAHSLKELHEGVAALLLTLVLAHIGAVLLMSVLQGENLAAAMLSGYKRSVAAQQSAASGAPVQQTGIRWSWWPVALLVVAGVLAFWWLQASQPMGLPQGSAQWGERGGQGDRGRWGGDDD